MKNLIYRTSQSPVIARAGHTFLQGFLAVWLLTGFQLTKVALIAAFMGGLSAVKTLVVEFVKGRRA